MKLLYKTMLAKYGRMKGSKGQSFIEVLVASFVIAFITVGIMSVAVLSQRMLFNSERHVLALSIINERKELIKSLSYDDVIVDPGGLIPSVSEAIVRNNQTYTLITNIEVIDDSLTAADDDYKKIEVVVEWTAPSGTLKNLSIVTYITSYNEPKVCTSCELGVCDLMTGICAIPDPPSGVLFEDSFTVTGNTELAAHVPEYGSGWVKIIGTGILQISGGSETLKGVACSSDEGVLYESIDEMSGANYEFSVKQVISSSTKGYSILAVRIQDVDNMYALKWNNKNTVSDPGIYKREDGIWTKLVGIDGIDVDNDSVVVLKVEGNIISMLDDGVEVVSVEDDTFLLPGRIGIGMGAVITVGDSCSSQRLDDVNVSLGGSDVACTPGLLCLNGALCPLTRVCPGDTTIPDTPEAGELCSLGEICSSGALCSLSGVCPAQSCPDGTCSSGNACFTGFCYPWEWYNLTFNPDDQGNPAEDTAMICAGDVCNDTSDCAGNCESDCQVIESDGFTGCGRWQVIEECGRTWIPECRSAMGGGAVAACRGGYDSGSCSDLECVPVLCPAPDPLVDSDRSWCVNGDECNLTSSNGVCISDDQCPAGEMCNTVSGACRTICPDKAGCSSYWGGWANGCKANAVVAGASDCNYVGGVCQGPAGDCAAEGTLSSVAVTIENVDPDNHSVVLSNPVEVIEGAVSESVDVAFRITLTGSLLDTIMVRINPQDGSATLADSDYVVLQEVLIFEPGDPLEQVATFSVTGDDVVEVDENFSVVITALRSIAQEKVITEAEAEVVIINDDVSSSSLPLPSPT